jgi:hypothetical protein
VVREARQGRVQPPQLDEEPGPCPYLPPSPAHPQAFAHHWVAPQPSSDPARGEQQGIPDDVFHGRPVIGTYVYSVGGVRCSSVRLQLPDDGDDGGAPHAGICNTWSELTPCNAHFRKIAEWVKRGVWEMGGFPLEFPVMSLGAPLFQPSPPPGAA